MKFKHLQDQRLQCSKRRGSRLRFQQLERRNLLAGDICHNFVEAGDVNLDGAVSALDAVVLINQLSIVVDSPAESHSVDAGETQWLLDVDANGELSLNDALQVVNQLGQQGYGTQVGGEGLAKLATAILMEDLPLGMHVRTAQDWFSRLHEKMDTPLLSRGAFDHLDGNGDGQLTKDELSDVHWRRISESDSDATGGVTRDEVKAARPSEHMLALLPTEAKPHFESLDADQDGLLSEDEVAEKLWDQIGDADGNEDGLVSLDELQEMREQRKLQDKQHRDIFGRFDENNDGLLTEDEVHNRVWDKINQADSNADSAISVDELHRLWEPEITVCAAPVLDRVFAHLDENLDGNLTEGEMGDQLWHLVSRADLDQDGSVSFMELQQTSDAWGPFNPDSLFEDLFIQFDLDGDGQLAADEVKETVWLLLEQADQNQDNLVALEEIFTVLKNADQPLIKQVMELVSGVVPSISDEVGIHFSLQKLEQWLPSSLPWLNVKPEQFALVAQQFSNFPFAKLWQR
ncbi:MAG: dockerin type I domain-containing protein [Rubripirellula sp.]